MRKRIAKITALFISFCMTVTVLPWQGVFEKTVRADGTSARLYWFSGTEQEPEVTVTTPDEGVQEGSQLICIFISGGTEDVYDMSVIPAELVEAINAQDVDIYVNNCCAWMDTDEPQFSLQDFTLSGTGWALIGDRWQPDSYSASVRAGEGYSDEFDAQQLDWMSPMEAAMAIDEFYNVSRYNQAFTGYDYFFSRGYDLDSVTAHSIEVAEDCDISLYGMNNVGSVVLNGSIFLRNSDNPDYPSGLNIGSSLEVGENGTLWGYDDTILHLREGAVIENGRELSVWADDGENVVLVSDQLGEHFVVPGDIDMRYRFNLPEGANGWVYEEQGEQPYEGPELYVDYDMDDNASVKINNDFIGQWEPYPISDDEQDIATPFTFTLTPPGYMQGDLSNVIIFVHMPNGDNDEVWTNVEPADEEHRITLSGNSFTFTRPRAGSPLVEIFWDDTFFNPGENEYKVYYDECFDQEDVQHAFVREGEYTLVNREIREIDSQTLTLTLVPPEDCDISEAGVDIWMGPELFSTDLEEPDDDHLIVIDQTTGQFTFDRGQSTEGIKVYVRWRDEGEQGLRDNDYIVDYDWCWQPGPDGQGGQQGAFVYSSAELNDQDEPVVLTPAREENSPTYHLDSNTRDVTFTIVPPNGYDISDAIVEVNLGDQHYESRDGFDAEHRINIVADTEANTATFTFTRPEGNDGGFEVRVFWSFYECIHKDDDTLTFQFSDFRMGGDITVSPAADTDNHYVDPNTTYNRQMFAFDNAELEGEDIVMTITPNQGFNLYDIRFWINDRIEGVIRMDGDNVVTEVERGELPNGLLTLTENEGVYTLTFNDPITLIPERNEDWVERYRNIEVDVNLGDDNPGPMEDGINLHLPDNDCSEGAISYYFDNDDANTQVLALEQDDQGSGRWFVNAETLGDHESVTFIFNNVQISGNDNGGVELRYRNSDGDEVQSCQPFTGGDNNEGWTYTIERNGDSWTGYDINICQYHMVYDATYETHLFWEIGEEFTVEGLDLTVDGALPYDGTETFTVEPLPNGSVWVCPNFGDEIQLQPDEQGRYSLAAFNRPGITVKIYSSQAAYDFDHLIEDWNAGERMFEFRYNCDDGMPDDYRTQINRLIADSVDVAGNVSGFAVFAGNVRIIAKADQFGNCIIPITLDESALPSGVTYNEVDDQYFDNNEHTYNWDVSGAFADPREDIPEMYLQFHYTAPAGISFDPYNGEISVEYSLDGGSTYTALGDSLFIDPGDADTVMLRITSATMTLYGIKDTFGDPQQTQGTHPSSNNTYVISRDGDQWGSHRIEVVDHYELFNGEYGFRRYNNETAENVTVQIVDGPNLTLASVLRFAPGEEPLQFSVNGEVYERLEISYFGGDHGDETLEPDANGVYTLNFPDDGTGFEITIYDSEEAWDFDHIRDMHVPGIGYVEYFCGNEGQETGTVEIEGMNPDNPDCGTSTYYGRTKVLFEYEDPSNPYAQFIITPTSDYRFDVTGLDGQGRLDLEDWPEEWPEITFVLKPSLADAQINILDGYLQYNGESHQPDINVMIGDEIVDPSEYNVVYGDNINAGYTAGTVAVSAVEGGNYRGQNSTSFTIWPALVNGFTARRASDEELYFNGSAQTPEILVFDPLGEPVTEGFDISYIWNVDVSSESNQPQAIAVFSGNYSGEVTVPFTINPADIADVQVGAVAAQTYTGSAITPEVTGVQLGDYALTYEDYTVSYANNIDVGTQAAITLTGTGNFTGEKTVYFTIAQNSIEDAVVVYDPDADLTYTGSAVTPGITVTLGDVLLEEGTDYNIVWNNNINAGENASLYVEGIGNYSGSSDKVFFTILPADLSTAAVEIAADADLSYTGEQITPPFTVTLGETVLATPADYTIVYGDNVAVGEDSGSIRVNGTGNYTGSVAVTFDIVTADIADAVITIDPNADLTFTGDQIAPAFTVTLNGRELTADTDYTYTYGENINAGVAAGSISITGTGNYTGNAAATFDIGVFSLSNAQITIDPEADLTYTGNQITPAFTVMLGETQLTTPADFTYEYGENVNVGANSGTITITGAGNYEGTATATFEIAPISLAGASIVIDPSADLTYTGAAIEPEITVILDNQVISASDGYTVAYGSNTDAGVGAGTVTVTGTGIYGGEISTTFTITPADISGAVVTVPDGTYTYSGAEIMPAVTVTLSGTVLASTDYTVAYDNNVNAGTDTATVTVTGTGNYEGSAGTTFTIAQADISSTNIVIDPNADRTYTGEQITPAFTVTLGDYELTDADFDVVYGENINAGMNAGSLTITGKGNFTGSRSTPFTIACADIETVAFRVADSTDFTYTGSQITGDLEVYFNGQILAPSNYEIHWGENTNVSGGGSVYLTGTGNFSGQTEPDIFAILPANIASCTYTAIPDQTFTGTVIVPSMPTVTDTNGNVLTDSDYLFQSLWSTDVTDPEHTPVLRLDGTGNYTGSLDIPFTIIPAQLSDCTADAVADQYVSGTQITPDLTVRLGDYVLEADDISIEYYDNTAVGQAYALISAGTSGNITGTEPIRVPFDIIYRLISECSIGNVAQQTYTGSAIRPEVELVWNGTALVEGTDYTVTYTNNTNASNGQRAGITITGAGLYDGTATVNFTIVGRSISNATISAIGTQDYTGEAITPSFTVTLDGTELTAGTDYTISYSNNVNAGTATITVRGFRNYTGSASTTFTIAGGPTPEPTEEVTPAPTADTPTPQPTEPTTPVPTEPSEDKPGQTTPGADTPTPTPEGSGVAGFVDRLYTVALGRASDPVGAADWVNAIRERGQTGADVARGFLYSPEFINKASSNEEFVETLYQTFFGRSADPAGLAAWVAVLEGGESRENVIEGFINSTEWSNLCLTYGIQSGGTGTPSIEVEPNQDTIDFCTRLYTTCLNRNADQNGLMAWARQLANQRDTGAGAARGFFFSSEFTNQNVSNGEYVTRLYRTFMGREPDEAGYNAWVAQLDAGVSREEVFDGFAASQEFTRICANYGIIRG